MQLLLPGINSTVKNQINKNKVFPDLRRVHVGNPQIRKRISILKMLKYGTAEVRLGPYSVQ